MPLYQYTCPRCRKTTEMFRPICDRNLATPCNCGAHMKLQVAAVAGVVRNPAVAKNK